MNQHELLTKLKQYPKGITMKSFLSNHKVDRRITSRKMRRLIRFGYVGVYFKCIGNKNIPHYFVKRK